MAGRHLLGVRLARLNRRAVQMRAAGPEFQAAEAILAEAAQQAQQPPAATTGQAPGVSAPVSAPAPAPAPVSGPVPDPSGPPPSVPTPPPAAPTTPPAAPMRPTAAPAPTVPLVPPAGGGAFGSGQQQPPQGQAGGQGGPGLRPVGPSSKAQTIRDVLAEDPGISDTDLIERVKAVHGDEGDPVKFAETVTRTRRRQENPKKKRSA